MYKPHTILLAAAALIGGISVAVTLNSAHAPGDRTYVGRETCTESGCHEGPHGEGTIFAGNDAFMATMHQQIHLRPNPQTVIIDRYFANDSVLLAPVRVGNVSDTLSIRLSKSADGREYFAQMGLLRSGESMPPIRIAYTYGGSGWIQRYLGQIGEHFYALPFQYVLPGYRDRSDTSNAFYFLDINKWLVGDPNTDRVSFIRWSTNTFRKLSWDRNCAPCHVTGYEMRVEERRVDTIRVDTLSMNPLLLDTSNVTRLDTFWHANWAGGRVDSASQDNNILIGCEACHGPGSEHADNPTAGNIIVPTRFGSTRAGTQMKLDLCNQCHSRIKSTDRSYNYPFNETTGRFYMPGTPLDDYIYKGDINYGASRWPDSSSYAHHQQGTDLVRSSVWSAHLFKDGCWSCHTIHYSKPGLPYQLNRDWYTLEQGKGCLAAGCHEEMGETEMREEKVINTHTQHSPQVSQCVNCHFTKTASMGFIGLPHKPLYEFSAHHFKVIRPVATIQMKEKGAFIGQINTCSEACHRNGRGSRNHADSMPAAPGFGIHDKTLGLWNESTDIALADTLWRHYQRMYSAIMSATREAGAVASSTGVTSVAPNPFTQGATIRFSLAAATDVQLEVFDLKGSSIRLLASGRHEAGMFAVEWDGSTEHGSPAPAGTYLVRLTTKQGSSSRQVVLAR